MASSLPPGALMGGVIPPKPAPKPPPKPPPPPQVDPTLKPDAVALTPEAAVTDYSSSDDPFAGTPYAGMSAYDIASKIINDQTSAQETQIKQAMEWQAANNSRDLQTLLGFSQALGSQQSLTPYQSLQNSASNFGAGYSDAMNSIQGNPSTAFNWGMFGQQQGAALEAKNSQDLAQAYSQAIFQATSGNQADIFGLYNQIQGQFDSVAASKASAAAADQASADAIAKEGRAQADTYTKEFGILYQYDPVSNSIKAAYDPVTKKPIRVPGTAGFKNQMSVDQANAKVQAAAAASAASARKAHVAEKVNDAKVRTANDPNYYYVYDSNTDQVVVAGKKGLNPNQKSIAARQAAAQRERDRHNQVLERQAAARLKLAKQKFAQTQAKKPKGGFTPAQSTKFTTKAVAIATRAANGFTNPTNGKFLPPLSWGAALLEMASAGIPQSIALEALDPLYPPGQNGRPGVKVTTGGPLGVTAESPGGTAGDTNPYSP